MAAPLYATVDDLAKCGVPPAALARISEEEKLAALSQASREADTRLANRYQLPLVSCGTELTQIVCIIAAFRLLTFRGWNPDDPNNGAVRMLYTEARQTLTDVAMGRATLSVVDTAPEPTFAPDIACDAPRGW